MTVRGPDWWREAYDYSPAPKTLFTVFGAEHSLGGIPNYEARETTDERPERVAAIQRISTAVVRNALGVRGAPVQDVGTLANDEGRIEKK
jgi:hypothetical protein